MEKREEFLNRIMNHTIEKEPRTEGFNLTEETIKEKIESYQRLLKSGIIERTTGGEER